MFYLAIIPFILLLSGCGSSANNPQQGSPDDPTEFPSEDERSLVSRLTEEMRSAKTKGDLELLKTRIRNLKLSEVSRERLRQMMNIHEETVLVNGQNDADAQKRSKERERAQKLHKEQNEARVKIDTTKNLEELQTIWNGFLAQKNNIEQSFLDALRRTASLKAYKYFNAEIESSSLELAESSISARINESNLLLEDDKKGLLGSIARKRKLFELQEGAKKNKEWVEDYKIQRAQRIENTLQTAFEKMAEINKQREDVIKSRTDWSPA